MSDFDNRKFKEYWSNTEIIREYGRILYTFSDTTLPYVFAAEHGNYKNRTIVKRGLVLVRKPQIILPRHYSGPEFKEGFEHASAIPPEVICLFRAMGIPYSHISNKTLTNEIIEYGSLQDVLNKLNRELDEQENSETALVKGIFDGADISLMRYTISLIIKSAPENVNEFFEHLRRQRGEPIRPDEQITDDDIKKLFG